MRRLVPLLFLTVIVGCNTDKVEAGRKMLDKDPAKAIEFFRQAAGEQPDCFQCLAYLGYGLERTGELEEAALVYEQAKELPEVDLRPEPVRQRLLGVYESLFNQAQGGEKLAIATKAAALETTLKVARPWANMFIEEGLQKQLTQVAQRGDEAAVRQTADKIQKLYLPGEAKQRAVTEATNALRTVFAKQVEGALKGETGKILEEKGLVDQETEEVTFFNEFTIPSEAADARFSPKSPDFDSNVRSEACLPLRAQLEELVKSLGPELRLKAIDDAKLDRAFAALYSNAQAGISLYGGEKRANPAGLPYLCKINASYSRIATELFRFWE